MPNPTYYMLLGLPSPSGGGGGGAGAAPSPLSIVLMANAELESAESQFFTTSNNSAPATGVAGAHGAVYDNNNFGIATPTGAFPNTATISVRVRAYFRVSSNAQTFFQVQDGSTITHLAIRWLTGGELEVFNLNQSFGTTTGLGLAINTWYEIELNAVLSDSVGSWTLRVGGVIPNKSGGGTMAQSGVDTLVGTGNPAQANRWAYGNTTLDTYGDDIVIDASGGEIGTGEVETLMPNGDGNYTQLTPNSGSTHYTRVNEKPNDGTTSFVSSTGASQRDSYTFDNRSLTGTPKGVMLIWRADRTTGSPTVTPFIRVGGVDYDGTAGAALGGSLRYQWQVWMNNPATGNAWTDTEINNLEAGLLCSATGARITQFAALVFVKS